MRKSEINNRHTLITGNKCGRILSQISEKNRGSIGSYVRRATAVTLAAAMLGASLPIYAKAPETGNVTNVVSDGKGRNINDEADPAEGSVSADNKDGDKAGNTASDGNASGKGDDVVTLRVCNWEEYIDLGGWDEDEAMELENGQTIYGDRPIYQEFEDWYYENYGVKVKVEYSCFGTNEELYSMLTLGDKYDLVCPSDYLIMKLMKEEAIVPFSDEFFDESKEDNYYVKGVSPYIRNVFDENEINGESWSKYAAGYMWGLTGILYNPEYVSYDEASTWAIINNPKFSRQVTVKDNVRDTYFAALGVYKHDLLTSDEFVNASDYSNRLLEEMNDVSEDTIDDVGNLLQDVRDNVYAFETDSGKADIVSGKIVANYQWSGDAVYAMDQAEEDGVSLDFAIPEECTNLWFDGWVMLKSGISEDPRKQQAAEAFVNYVSRPDNAVRNMYYIGYTSVISGGDDDTIIDYVDYNFGAEEDEEDTFDYNLGYFFAGDKNSEDYIVTAPMEQMNRQLTAQYPSAEDISHSAIMLCFDDDAAANINQMWIDVRCYNIKDVPVGIWIFAGAVVVLIVAAIMRKKMQMRKY